MRYVVGLFDNLNKTVAFHNSLVLKIEVHKGNIAMSTSKTILIDLAQYDLTLYMKYNEKE